MTRLQTKRPVYEEMRYLSVCAGIEAASVAWHHMGWEPVAFSEIEKFPSAVLAHHYPNVPNWGDMTKYKEWPNANIDVLVGGTPCQSFSVAGLREGLADPRGNLMLTYLGIAQKYRPEWLVWENVPGVLSSNGGQDFASLLRGMAELGYGFAFRILDAQYFGVAQRRRRVFVVGNARSWQRAAAVLFERHSLSGDSAPRRKKRKEVSGTLTARTNISRDSPEHLVPDTVGTLCDGAHMGGGLNGQDAYSGRIIPVELPVSFSATMSIVQTSNDLSSTLQAKNPIAVAFSCSEVGPTMGSSGPPYSRTGNERVESDALAVQNMQVRRLTPRECERLQGFPDDYTLIPYRNKPAADGPRYKALGNSMAVPVMRWIGERVKKQRERND